MPVSITLNATAAVALFAQFLIFVYLYYSSADRPRFFRYLIWAWGLFAVLKASHLSRQVFPEAAGALGLLDAAGGASVLFILAAGMAYRWDYRIRWQHAALGAVYAIGGAVLGAMFGNDVSGVPWRALLGGGVLMAGGLVFWPWRARPVPHRGERFLATSLVLWGLHWVITPFLPASPGTGAAVAVTVTFLLLYYLTVFTTIILVLDRARGAMAALKEFNERLVDGLGEGLELVDGAFTIRHANRWIAQQFGPVVGRRCYEVLTTDSRQCPGCPLADRQHLDMPAHVEVTGPGDRRLRLTCSPVRQPDGQTLLLELVADVTEEERLRVRLSEAERLATAGELATGVAHEIRNPLAAILNATKLLERQETLTTEERTSILEAIKTEAGRLNATLSDFLLFARPREPKRVLGDIREVVAHVATLLREERARAGGVQVEVRLDPAVPLCAFDPDQLAQVLWNLVLNGVEAMGGQGRLRLAVEGQHGEVRIAVSDTGTGIPPEEQRRIFQPFVSKRPGGTGLGLAIARRIISAHGGHIDVESVSGQGSCFTVCLPVAEG